MRTQLFCALFVSALIYGCTEFGRGPEPVAVLVEGSGVYSRPISTDSDLAQQFFDQGLRLTWGYYFPEAVASHQEALRQDPDNPMIYWGLALALGPGPNSRYSRLPDDPQGEARNAISRALELIANANDEERALIEALSVRFDSDTYPARDARDRAYFEAASSLYQRYPEDPDVVTLFADAFMVMTPWVYWDKDGRPKAGTEEVAEALENVMERHPYHPGANHIYIHLIEAGPNPARALEQADRLEALMPIAGHVVHMPSHIYVRLGQYDRAIANNERSVAADRKFLEIWGDRPFPKIGTYYLSAENHSRHAHDFIRYAAGIQGNYARAIVAARTAVTFEREESIRRGPGQRTVATVWLVHRMFGKWDALSEETRGSDGSPYLDGIWLYVQGSAHVGRGELALAEEAVSSLQELLRDPSLETLISRFNPTSNVLRIAALGLEGEIKQAQGNLEEAIMAFEAAVRIEDELSYVEPPDWAQPMRHYLGAALMEAGRAEEAERIYRQDLTWNQNNGWSLFGLWKSLEAQGRTEDARAVAVAFQKAWKNADFELSRSRF